MFVVKTRNLSLVLIAALVLSACKTIPGTAKANEDD